jgi:hypothetical protein
VGTGITRSIFYQHWCLQSDLTLELSGGAAVRLNEMLDVTSVLLTL